MLGQASVNHSVFPREYLLFSKRHRYRYHSGQQPTSVPKLKKLNFPVQGSFKPLLSIMPVQSASSWPRMTGASAGEGKTYVCLPPCTHSLAGDGNTHSRPVAPIFISTAPRILHCRKATGLKQILFILAVVYIGLIGFSKPLYFQGCNASPKFSYLVIILWIFPTSCQLFFCFVDEIQGLSRTRIDFENDLKTYHINFIFRFPNSPCVLHNIHNISEWKKLLKNFNFSSSPLSYQNMWFLCTTNLIRIKERPSLWDHWDITLPIF